MENKRNIPASVFRYLVFAVIITLNACTSSYYPNTVNVPILESAGESNVSALLGDFGTEIQTAYAISNHIALMANGGLKTTNIGFDSVRSAYFIGELGAGFLQQYNDEYLISAFVGYGVYQIDHENFKNYSDSSIIGKRAFVQPSVTYLGEYADVSFATRLCYVDYTLNNDQHYFYAIEPSITFEAGEDAIKFLAQVRYSNIHEQEVDLYEFAIIDKLYFSLGIKVFPSALFTPKN